MKTAKDLNWSSIKWMKPEEFDDPNYPDSWQYMDPKTILLCEWLRKNTGWPLVIHSQYNIHGAVCMTKQYHSPNSYHNFDNPNGCSAVDFHFLTKASPREQAQAVMHSGFKGIGIYQGCWRWPGKWSDPDGFLPIGFHCDRRKYYQIWKMEKGEYVYLLN